MAEAQARAEEAKRQFTERTRNMQKPEEKEADNEMPMKDMTVSRFEAGVPLAERKRRQIEKQWDEQMTAFLAKQKRRFMKSAGAMKKGA